MPRDNENGRKRRYSDVLEDLYRGPQDFMEAGARGFLITSIPDREEHSIDETVKVLRKTCVKLYGGIKPLKREDASFAKGYVMVDFMDPETVINIPNPDAEKAAEEEEKAKAATEETEEATKEETKETEEMEEENKTEQEEEVKPEGGDAIEEKEKTVGEGEAAAPETKDTKPKEEKKKKEDTRRRRDEDKKPLMLAPYKFNAYRTELRNIMFIKSDIPDPVEVVNACFDMMLNRKPLYTDCVNQLLPVQGVCNNDYKQLEIMCRRVLVPYFGEHLEEPPSFGVMLINKMCEPGAEVLLDVVRSAIWCLNPLAWQSSPWAEPDVVVHVELIGSKIVISAMPHYMKYRQYSPFVVHELGAGKPEDEVQLLKEMKEENSRDRERGGRGGKGRDRRGHRDREDRKKHSEKEHEKKEGGEEASKDTENTQSADKENTVNSEKEHTEEAKEEEPTESSADAAEEEKKVSPEKKSTKAKKSKS